MTLKLILIRHGKSGWDDPTHADHERPLALRGQVASAAIGAWLVAQGHAPDQVLCSTARRAIETCEGVLEAAGLTPEIVFNKHLYLASPAAMLTALQEATGRAVAMIGHNPGIAAFAEDMAASPADHADFARYPTGATTVFEFDADDWASVTPATGRIVEFVVPRELEI